VTFTDGKPSPWIVLERPSTPKSSLVDEVSPRDRTSSWCNCLKVRQDTRQSNVEHDVCRRLLTDVSFNLSDVALQIGVAVACDDVRRQVSTEGLTGAEPLVHFGRDNM
jgi:hypothetical protein